MSMSLFEPYRERLASEKRPVLVDLRIRPASPDDVPDVVDVPATREGLAPAEVMPQVEEAVAASLANSEKLILVAEHRTAVVGFGKAGRFTPGADAPADVGPAGWYLTGMVVAAEHRRQGIGRALTRARLDWISQRDTQVFYFANVRNRASIALHQEFGFVELTRAFSFPGVSFDGGAGVLFVAHLQPS